MGGFEILTELDWLRDTGDLAAGVWYLETFGVDLWTFGVELEPFCTVEACRRVAEWRGGTERNGAPPQGAEWSGGPERHGATRSMPEQAKRWKRHNKRPEIHDKRLQVPNGGRQYRPCPW